MSGCTRLRALRLRHGVSLTELAQTAGVSTQYMSRVELGELPPTRALEKKCAAALEELIARRRQTALALEYAYRVEKGGLLRDTEGNCHEL